MPKVKCFNNPLFRDFIRLSFKVPIIALLNYKIIVFNKTRCATKSRLEYF